MPLKITCPQCGEVQHLSAPYPLPGTEIHCACGRVLVLSFPADLMARMNVSGARFQDDPDPARDIRASEVPGPEMIWEGPQASLDETVPLADRPERERR